MDEKDRKDRDLQARVRALEAENRRLRAALFAPRWGDTVRVPEGFRPIFDAAEKTVGAYFRQFLADPSQGTIEIAGERYVLVRAAALSYGFLSAVQRLYSDRGEEEALHIGKTLLFDISHVIGINDARNFHRKMGLTDPVAKMSAGPVHFAYSGWAFVDLLPECNPVPSDDFYLKYHHPFSFESDSWQREGKRTDFTVCTMNAGYSSGWCEESFGFPLSAAEITCRAKGDDNCTFVMAPPHRLRGYVERALSTSSKADRQRAIYDIPTLFERKDVEERLRRALDRAEAASEAKSLFLANMSHEIRTPLTGVLGMANLLLRKDLGATQRKYVEMIDRSGQALLAILNDILDLSRIEAGRMKITSVPCDVRQVLKDVQDVLGARVAEKGLTFEVQVAEALPPFVASDSLRLRQIVLNLAGNAVKFTEHGRIEVRAEWPEVGTLRVEVQDTGIGIEPASVEGLFEVFTQADASHARRYSGSGLGLSITRHLVELMGGEIDVCSAVGVGSTFRFTLPVSPAKGTPEESEGEDDDPLQVDARILVVEDDRIARYVVEKMLAEHGCRVDSVADGREAVAAVTGGGFDLAFMDCQMPGMDGYEATMRIRQLEAGGRRTPIVGMTASVMKSDSDRCQTAGMDDFIGKPLDPAMLRSTLARWLQVEA